MIPEPAKERLLYLMRLLEGHGGETITSAEAELLTGWSSHTIRKDISYLPGDEAMGNNAGYAPDILIPAIRKALHLERQRRLCVVGLGRLGSAYLNFPGFKTEEYELVAGFDINVNRVEILKSPVPLYPVYKAPDIIRRFSIETALLCVPADAAQEAAEKLVDAGIRGILNFAPVALKVSRDVMVRNVNVVDELRALSVRLDV